MPRPTLPRPWLPPCPRSGCPETVVGLALAGHCGQRCAQTRLSRETDREQRTQGPPVSDGSSLTFAAGALKGCAVAARGRARRVSHGHSAWLVSAQEVSAAGLSVCVRSCREGPQLHRGGEGCPGRQGGPEGGRRDSPEDRGGCESQPRRHLQRRTRDTEGGGERSQGKTTTETGPGGDVGGGLQSNGVAGGCQQVAGWGRL